MEDNISSCPSCFDKILEALRGPYMEAVKAHLEYEVFSGVRNKKALQDFEAVLAHLADALLKNDPSQISHLISHCQRIAVETTEFVAETLLDSIRSRFDPYYKHPHLSRMLLLTKPSFLGGIYETLKTMQEMITEGRKLKGNDETYKDCLKKFNDAVVLGKELDKKTPLCPFGDRLFALILAVITLAVGWVLGFLTPR